ncbi:copper homeostasis protein CutC [Mucilaginibacter sp. RS28]|uniref:PF03932 family protein CutC n=1 Tax=Mucilaginibacter straminoryzae TaxID=2932774 RepID=A0A9X1X2F3_9SPHI|nr:copper homeostasis protein CutC [Mucilaginibacter straminoryzae]MCJ8209904.1 copper homeostasis protein CutC [Mucilaginibacter straminoryzae]
MRNPVSLEVFANSASSAAAAQLGGAHSVLLCENLNQAGTTPSYGQIITARKSLTIPLSVLIRPREGDFLYNDTEFNIMLADTEICIDAGCDGIAVGVLNADGTVDKERCEQLIARARNKGLRIVFHRAFDTCINYQDALEDLISLGFTHLVTSGGKTTAMEGAATINKLVSQAGNRINIIAGSGITENNVNYLLKFTGVQAIQTSARSTIYGRMDFQNTQILMGNRSHYLYAYEQTSAKEVRRLVDLLNASASEEG